MYKYIELKTIIIGLFWVLENKTTQSICTSSKSTTETLGQGVKYVQS